MSTRYVVDAHAVIWYLESNAKLGASAKAILNDTASDLVLPVIALAEAAHVVNKGKTLITDVPTLFDRVQRDARFEIYPSPWPSCKKASTPSPCRKCTTA